MITINRSAQREIVLAHRWLNVFGLNVVITIALMMAWVNPYAILAEIVIGAIIELGMAWYHAHQADIISEINAKRRSER